MARRTIIMARAVLPKSMGSTRPAGTPNTSSASVKKASCFWRKDANRSADRQW